MLQRGPATGKQMPRYPGHRQGLKEGAMNQKALRSFALLAVIILMIQVIPAEAGRDKRISLLLWDEDSRFVDCEKGIRDQLKSNGYGEPGVTITMDNVRGSKSRLAEVVTKFTTAKPDMIITVGTIPTLAVTKEIKDVPVIFGMVYDPVEAGIASSWKSSGNNTTGASPLIPMSTLIGSLKQFTPVKTLAVLYTADEKQSRIQLLELKKIQTSFQLKVIPVILSEKEGVTKTLASVVRTADAIYLTGATIIGATIPTIVGMANSTRVVTITHLPDYVTKGVLIGVCANAYFVGRLAGEKAVQVLRGAKPSAVPVETEKRVDVILNSETAAAGQFQIPPSFMERVTIKILNSQTEGNSKRSSADIGRKGDL
jgi:putative ABC transport system substrate-binding protein